MTIFQYRIYDNMQMVSKYPYNGDVYKNYPIMKMITMFLVVYQFK